MNTLTTFTKDENKITVYGTYEKPLFKASEIGKSLGFVNIRENISKMNPKYKDVRKTDTLGGAQSITFLTEAGLYYLIMRSSKKEAIAFQEWVCMEVLPSIRKTGQYSHQHKQFKICTYKIETEFDLHKKTVNFIRNRYPNSLITATLGENQTTSELRYKSKLMGYDAGSPDIIIQNMHKQYSGFCIEFKSPKGNGTLSDNQIKMLEKYKNNNFKVLVSNDYDEIIENVIKYYEDIRIRCQYCQMKFKNEDTLKSHHRYFHKIE